MFFVCPFRVSVWMGLGISPAAYSVMEDKKPRCDVPGQRKTTRASCAITHSLYLGLDLVWWRKIGQPVVMHVFVIGRICWISRSLPRPRTQNPRYQRMTTPAARIHGQGMIEQQWPVISSSVVPCTASHEKDRVRGRERKGLTLFDRNVFLTTQGFSAIRYQRHRLCWTRNLRALKCRFLSASSGNIPPLIHIHSRYCCCCYCMHDTRMAQKSAATSPFFGGGRKNTSTSSPYAHDASNWQK